MTALAGAPVDDTGKWMWDHAHREVRRLQMRIAKAVRVTLHLAKLQVVLAALLTIILVGGCATPGQKITRGYFGLGDHEQVVHVTSSSDFNVNIWARNVETSVSFR